MSQQRASVEFEPDGERNTSDVATAGKLDKSYTKSRRRLGQSSLGYRCGDTFLLELAWLRQLVSAA